MENLLAAFVATSVIGLFLYSSYFIYDKYRNFFVNWQKALFISIAFFTLPFVLMLFLDQNSIVGSIVFFICFILAFFFFISMLFSYNDNVLSKTKEKFFTVNTSSKKCKSPSDFYIREIDKYIEFFDNELFSKEIGSKIKASFKKKKTDFDKNPIYKKEDGTTNVNNVRLAASSIVIQMIESMILSGDYHLYRGVLSEEGKSLVTLWELMMQKYLNLNPVSQDNVALDDNWLKEQRINLQNEIKDIG